MQLVAFNSNIHPFSPKEESYSRFNDADYLSVMCHEIGAPLTAIIGLSHVLTNVNCSIEKKQECADMLRDSANMLLGLMKNMLDSSKLEAGKMELEHTDFNINKVVQEAVHIISTKVAEKGLKLHLYMTDTLSSNYMGDPLRILQILLNLLNNAVKFTEKGYVSLRVTTQFDEHGAEQLCLTVADTGTGMSEEEREKIFSAYVQANAAITRKHGGTGLGLSISQNLAHLMGGEITVKSWPGMGSHFVVTLPLAKTPVLLEVA